MSTIVGLAHLNVHVAQAMSLKDKRRIIKSFKARAANGYKVSIAEVDGLESLRRAVLAVVMVGKDKRHIESTLQKIINAAATHRDMVLVDHEVQWL